MKSPSQRRIERQVRAPNRRHFSLMALEGGECHHPMSRLVPNNPGQKIPAKQTASLYGFFFINNWKDLKALKLYLFSLRKHAPLVSGVDTQ